MIESHFVVVEKHVADEPKAVVLIVARIASRRDSGPQSP